ncbi:MAG: glycine--tRNA ligase [Planctomycetota bacterium]
MTDAAAAEGPITDPALKSMEDLVSLCKRRGFVFPASEIYGGLNGFWDYGPLGAQLKNNLRDAWWRSMVLAPPLGPDGEPVRVVGLDSSIIQNPRVWEASGHVAGFNDPMVDCRESKSRYRADHLIVLRENAESQGFAYIENNDESRERALKLLSKYLKRTIEEDELQRVALTDIAVENLTRVVGPDVKEPGTLTEPRQFNLMFQTYVGALQSEDAKAYLRPETAQGIFLNYKNVLDTTRVRVPFGIAQVGKAFRNEVTPRNFIFRSREFEQMEMEWFCPPNEAATWFEFWKQARMDFWKRVGLSDENLLFRQHDSDELSHYAKEGVGTADIEYRYPFTAPGTGELEGIAHRTDFDLQAHAQHSKAKLEYFDQERNERYMPHVIEPASGLTRGVLAILCDAYTPDPGRPSKVYLRFTPEMAPVKAAIFPLVNKDGMPEKAAQLYEGIREKVLAMPIGGTVEFDAKQNIGKRYARMDEAGCPCCFTVDGQTLEDQTVTVRDRDTLSQERISIEQAPRWFEDKVKN